MENLATIIAYHGCERSLALDIVAGKKSLNSSNNEYDWLGHGIYFWENDAQRALEWARKRKCKKPFIVGAVIRCKEILDLSNRDSIDLVKSAYSELLALTKKHDIAMPSNSSFSPNDKEEMKRELDCAVINYLCNDLNKKLSVDAVMSPFFEGKPIYPHAKIYEFTHTQIAVRNPKCILGYFIPQDFVRKHKLI